VQIVRSVVIDCHVEDVFDYLADPRNDGAWRADRRAALTCAEREPPHRIVWRWDADGEVVEVGFALEPVWTSTRVTVREEQRTRIPRRARRDLDRRLETLRQRLERR
jgi:uncharacterized protein YndB with AHSA1/START domain